MRGAGLLLSALAAFVASCAPSAPRALAPSHELADIPPLPDVANVVDAESTIPPAPHTPMPALLSPKVAVEPPAKPEGHLAHPVCVGPINPKKDPPHAMACCYPSKELIVRPIRAAFPALRACYDRRKNKSAEGRVVFVFRVEQDGTIPRVCTGEATAVEDEDAVRCMVEAMRKVTYGAMSDEERKMCGLLSFNYPVVFEP